jgi:hypothetical protein
MAGRLGSNRNVEKQRSVLKTFPLRYIKSTGDFAYEDTIVQAVDPRSGAFLGECQAVGAIPN